MNEEDIRNANIETIKAKKVDGKYIIIGKDELGIPVVLISEIQ